LYLKCRHTTADQTRHAQNTDMQSGYSETIQRRPDLCRISASMVSFSATPCITVIWQCQWENNRCLCIQKCKTV